MKFTSPNHPGYVYDDATGLVTSLKGKTSYQMTWVKDSKGYHYRVRLQSRYGGADSVRKDRVAQVFSVAIQPTITPQSQTPSINKGFIVGTLSNAGEYSFASKPKVHASYPEARAEAERLARSFTDKRFIVTQILGAVKATGVTWE